ncbi:hypothetical protein, partial [Pseudomonas putida]|uniref:hypothetical protein n=1 Tax=Pseudomonas putida TaxID=303 RepID=UPI0039058399
RAALDLTGAENPPANTSKFQRRPLKIPTPPPQNSNAASPRKSNNKDPANPEQTLTTPDPPPTPALTFI